MEPRTESVQRGRPEVQGRLLGWVAALVVLAGAGLTMSCLPPAEQVRGYGAGPDGVCPGCNVLLISMDTLRADHLGAYGYSRPTSPNIDALAREAVVFENAVSQSAWTRPAHTSMLTGLYPSEHGVIGLKGNRGVPSGVRTLAGEFSAAGYTTRAFTGGANMAPVFGYGRDFDSYEVTGRRFEDHLPAVRGFLDDRGQRPFFLFLHAFDPHKPYKSLPEDRRALGLPEERAQGMSAACKDGDGPEDLAPFIAEYDAAIHRGDRSLGRLFAMLDQRGLLADTVIAFTSDHGEEFLEHGHCFHIRTLYREVVNVPLILRVPGAAPGRVQAVVPASVAIPSTLLELVGLLSHEMPGPSLARHWSGGVLSFPGVASETRSHFGPGGGLGHVRAWTTDQDKALEWVDAGYGEFFDTLRDPAELNDLFGGPASMRRRRSLKRWWQDHPELPGVVDGASLSGELRRELRELGYVE